MLLFVPCGLFHWKLIHLAVLLQLSVLTTVYIYLWMCVGPASICAQDKTKYACILTRTDQDGKLYMEMN